jgi:hypothetical protein
MPNKSQQKTTTNNQGVKVSWVWQATRQVKKSGLASYSDHLGTIRLDQIPQPIRELYARNWHILKPSSFKGEDQSEKVKKTIKRQVQILIPAMTVKAYRAGKRPASKAKAIQRAISALVKGQQPVNTYTIKGLIALDGMDATPRYIYGMLKELDYAQAYHIANVPYWTPKVSASKVCG